MEWKKVGTWALRVSLGLYILVLTWVVPPALHKALHYCPVRPDGVPEASAMPQWARRYGMECSVCHTTVPELTPMGYNFRRAGFRMPDEIGKDAKFSNISDLYSGRIREDFGITGAATDSSGKAVKATNQFLFNEFTFYPVTGAFGKYWSSMVELSFVPDATTEIENAYIRGTFPVNNDLYLTARAGIMHPQEGFGGSDRPITNFRPLFQVNTAKHGAFDTGAKLWNQDQQGLEVGATYKDTTLSLAIFNGYNSAHDAADIATRGLTGKSGLAATAEYKADTDNQRDFLFFFNQLIGQNAGVSLEYINGKSNWLPAGTALAVAAVPQAGQWTNNYQRLIGYANYKVVGDKLNLLGGFFEGKDHLPSATVASDNTDSFNSTGWFVGAESKVMDHLSGLVRYDTFKPSTRVAGNRLSSVTTTAVFPFDWVKFMIDYQVKRTQYLTQKDRTDNTLQAEWMVHF